MNKIYHPAFNINIKQLAKGLVSIIKDHPDSDCFSFGMFPSDVMEVFENNLKEKIPNSFYWENGETEQERVCDNGEQIRKEIIKDICAEALKDPCAIV